ncbi:bifunctional hydroxyethylthiazole kinase/thiamine-phosphate diphosphorylase [Saccharomycopsis crataegensis]|uniref:Bifunctional hydroxyethylthiazole kinase/thiamine-phosphate diphosphorylase n=1 Tax=Saccharomycopsis crataegensis TaxID=43959 RepID=A0AAV5QKH2_9ASCO|nr:bifunctional hydroxyethylthiazole kinase/thiamine-phosphate diphosphorylase [Saccharomycopsis crataegensis]
MSLTIDKNTIDYSLYLVTNSEIVPESLDFYDQVEKALQNGVTIVQLREKNLDTDHFIDRARKLHQITKKYNVPLLINDRIDVALAIDAEGVHVGQDDMAAEEAREKIGQDKILGVTVNNERDAMAAIKSTARIDYLGIGSAYSTTTKEMTKPILGPGGIKKILEVLHDGKPEMKSVIIGGLNKYNITRTLNECRYKDFCTNGAAVVSCIMASHDASLATKETLRSINLAYDNEEALHPYKHPNIVQEKPLTHFITNAVAKYFSANVCIAIGGSPIMSELSEEFSFFAKISKGSLCMNTGTMSNASIHMYKKAISEYNAHMVPIIYDPVACGATQPRREIAKMMIEHGRYSVIKGNMAEICSLAGANGVTMRGVDSDLNLNDLEIVDILSKLAVKTQAVIVMTGKKDIIVDGIIPTKKPRVCFISGGHELMGKITASGCALGGVIASYLAVCSYFHTFEAAIDAVALYKEAGYLAGQQSKGPGTFLANFTDELYELSRKPYRLLSTNIIRE